ncbi:MAG: hypothetical protein AB2A00_27315 [Myxococcota bacterium]
MFRAPVPAAVLLAVTLLWPTVSWAPPDAGPSAACPPGPTDDAFGRALTRAMTLHREGDDAAARRALLDALDEARARAPLEVHHGTVITEPPENLGMYRPAPGSMVFGDTVLLYLEVDNHGFRKRPEGLEVDLWTDVFILYEDGERIGGKERFGEHRFVSRTPHRTTHMVLEMTVSKLPPQPYWAEVVVHDAVSGKVGRTRIPFRVAARPGH